MMEYYFLDQRDIDKFLKGFSWKDPKKRIRTTPFNSERLRGVISEIKRGSPISEFPTACHKLVWELMKCQTHIRKLEQRLDKLEANG